MDLQLLSLHSSLNRELFIIYPTASIKPACPYNLHSEVPLRHLMGFNISLLKGWSTKQQHLHHLGFC